MKVKHMILLACSQLLGACASVPPQQGSCTVYLEKYVVGNAEADANKNFRSKTKYLLGIQGYSVTFPGVTDPLLPQRIGYRVLDGTSDAIIDESCASYQLRAKEYAERYNRHLLQLMIPKP